MPDAYDTANDAVYYAAQRARAKYGNKKESIHLVYEQDGKFYFADPASSDSQDSRARGKFMLPKGAQLRFIVHNHPQGYGSDLFSDEDIANAERLKIPSAIIFGAQSPTIRVYTPGQTATRATASQAKTSFGDPYAPDPVIPSVQRISGAL